MKDLQEIVNSSATRVKYFALAAVAAIAYGGCGGDECDTDKDCKNGQTCQEECTEYTGKCGNTSTSCRNVCVEEGTSQSSLRKVEKYVFEGC